MTFLSTNGIMTDQWVSGIVDTVGTSVYYLYTVVAEGKNSSKYSEQLLMGLIKSTIKGTTEFFSDYGLHPSPPDWFKDVQEKMVDPNLIMRAIEEVLESKGTAEKDLNAIYKKESNYMINLQENLSLTWFFTSTVCSAIPTTA